MKATELIGKLAIRNKATKEVGDISYTTEPVFIIDATDSHITCRTITFIHSARKIRILNFGFCDDAWVDFAKEFPKEVVEEYLKLKK